jgi:hypothetical protein
MALPITKKGGDMKYRNDFKMEDLFTFIDLNGVKGGICFNDFARNKKYKAMESSIAISDILHCIIAEGPCDWWENAIVAINDRKGINFYKEPTLCVGEKLPHKTSSWPHRKERFKMALPKLSFQAKINGISVAVEFRNQQWSEALRCKIRKS